MDYREAISRMKKALKSGTMIGSVAETKKYYIFWIGTKEELNGPPNVSSKAVTVMDKITGRTSYWSFGEYCDAVDRNEVRWIDMNTGKRTIPG